MFARGWGVGDAVFIGAVSVLFIKHYYQISFEQLLLLGCSAVLVVIGIASEGDKCKVPPPPRRSDGMPVGNNAPTTIGRRGEQGNHSAILTEELANLGGPTKFSCGELRIATNSFASDRKLGGGGSGIVYKGHIGKAHTPVAVKKITSGARQGITEYKSEVKSLSQLRHRNLVQLTGYGHQANEFILIYEFMKGGSLEDHLFKGGPILTWERRYNISLALASALHYLQKQCCQCVIHRDIKYSNVMLDEECKAKLGDFGLARLVNHTRDPITTQVKETSGYWALECFQTGKTSKKSDIYDFGIVLLEIGSGRRAVDLGGDPQNLAEWDWKQYGPRKLHYAVDERHSKNFDKKQAEALMIVGLWCAHPIESWPLIEEAMAVLNLMANPPKTPLEDVKFRYIIERKV